MDQKLIIDWIEIDKSEFNNIKLTGENKLNIIYSRSLGDYVLSFLFFILRLLIVFLFIYYVFDIKTLNFN